MKLHEISKYTSDTADADMAASRANDRGRLDAAIAVLFKEHGYDASDKDIASVAQNFNVVGKTLERRYKAAVADNEVETRWNGGKQVSHEGLDEGWSKPAKQTGEWTADASEIWDHSKMTNSSKVRCPVCRDSLEPSKVMTAEKDREGEVTNWKGDCPKCKTHLKIFND